jgi:hypothetical protein
MQVTRATGALLLGLLAACSRPPDPSPSAPWASIPPAAPPPPASVEPPAPPPAPAVSASSHPEAPDTAPAPPRFTPDEVAAFLLLGAGERAGCAGQSDEARCLIGARYGGELREDALKLHTESGTVVGLEEPGELDGGYRGKIRIVPQEPAGKYARHLGWVAGSLREFDRFFAWLGGPARYRWAPLGLRFYRSVGKRTPAAYAHGWQVAYNVEGGINTSADAVRETMFHEVFHLNDGAHGVWSERALGEIFERIVARCGARTPCLAPYAPGATMVRGGTYYAFQPGNGVAEYAAELALRYYIEHRLVWRGQPVRRPFKCGPAENRAAWGKLVAEFFGQIDRIPDCAGPP